MNPNAIPASSPQQKIAIGILMIVGSGCLLSVMDTFSKHLGQTIDVMFVIWGRYFFHTVLTTLFLSAGGSFSYLKSNKPKLQTIRASLLLLATVCMYNGLQFMSLAEATAIMFLAPMLMTAFSVPLLGERVGLHRWSAVVAGFIGVVLVIRPGAEVFNPFSFLPLAAAVCVSLYMILTRTLSTQDRQQTTTFYSTAVGTLVLSAGLPFFWSSLEPLSWVLMVSMGATGAIGHFLLIKAFHRAPASVLAPFTYSQLIFSGLLSIWIFGDIPDTWGLAGAALILAGGLYVWYRETFAVRPPRSK